MKKLVLITTLLMTTSCINPSKIANKVAVVDSMRKSIDKKYPDVKTIEAKDLILKRSQKSFSGIIVDCRTTDEMKVSMIGGAAPLEMFDKIKTNFKDKVIYTYSTVGSRAAQYAQKLTQEGFNAVNLSGGILTWLHAGGDLKKAGSKEEARKVKLLNKAWNLLPKGFEGIVP
jgi:rhodanese-related sulfurtransferase